MTKLEQQLFDRVLMPSIENKIDSLNAEIKKLKEENAYLKKQNEKLLNRVLNPLHGNNNQEK